MDLGGQAGLSLSLSELADDLCTRALGPLLLRNRIVGAQELRTRAVSAGVGAVASNLATMASIAGALDNWLRHGDLCLIITSSEK